MVIKNLDLQIKSVLEVVAYLHELGWTETKRGSPTPSETETAPPSALLSIYLSLSVSLYKTPCPLLHQIPLGPKAASGNPEVTSPQLCLMPFCSPGT